jgi:hypothetical protein
MRLSIPVVLSVLLSSVLVAQAVASDEAGAADKKHKARKPTAAGPATASPPRPDGYHELLADKMPIGSTQWWEQMRREGRLGGETP